MDDFFQKIKIKEKKPVFVFSTYGMMASRALKGHEELSESKGFNVIAGFALHTPENYPPLRKGNMAFDNAPNPKELTKFNEFIDILDKQLKEIKSGKIPTNEKIKTGIMGAFTAKSSRRNGKIDFGVQNVDEKLCDECGICKKVCPYEAIEMLPKPKFDHDKCRGCWACYNHCPKQAIYTPKFDGEYQYATPIKELIDKLG